MKNLKVRFLALCGLMVLVSASVASFAASAQVTCPPITVECGGKVRSCAGTPNGNKCDYDRSCVNCPGEVGGEESSQ